MKKMRTLVSLLCVACLLSLPAGCAPAADQTPPPAQTNGSEPPAPAGDTPGSGTPITGTAAPGTPEQGNGADIERYVAEAVAREAVVEAQYRNEQQYPAASRVSIERMLDLFFLLVRAQFETTDDVDFSPFWDPESENQQSLADFEADIRSCRSAEAPVLWSNFYGLSVTPKDYAPRPGETVELTVGGSILLLYSGSSLVSGMTSNSDVPYAANWPINHRVVLTARDNRWYISELEFLGHQDEGGLDAAGLPLSDLAFDPLDVHCPAGPDFHVAYESDQSIIIWGAPGLFGYDLTDRKVTFSVDFVKALGQEGIVQGSHGTGVVVTSDGKSIIFDDNSLEPDSEGYGVVYYIDVPTLTYYRSDVYEPIEDYFDPESAVGGVIPGGELIDTVYFRGDPYEGERWAIFEGYGQP